ncbi:hypothetical protein [Myroides guanonis]|uniref:Uncharacterized protein n=1 Tax=Myroides guanonis TaxID=1150112 RepID=A0A1I3RM29_9FLAO|nr:hypothetical protein [Myroides guanonis]SFJ46307.1 hypothetical protein SAMN04487893_10845 [Myroides guanonis]
MKKVTEEQIKELHSFTKRRFVEYYDVELELVDHLANGIEEQWRAHPELSFDEALQKEYKKFGIFGFVGMIEKKQAELHNYYYKITFQALKDFFSIPKIVVTVAIFLLLFAFGTTFKEYASIGYGIVFYGLFVYTLVDGFRKMIVIKRRQKNAGKKWLIDSVANQFYAIPFGVIFINVFNISNSILGLRLDESLSPLRMVLASGFLTLFVLLFIITRTVIRPVLNSELEKAIRNHQLI